MDMRNSHGNDNMSPTNTRESSEYTNNVDKSGSSYNIRSHITSSTSTNNMGTSYCSEMVDSSTFFNEQLAQLFDSKESSDLKLNINGGLQCIDTHRFVLSLRSQVFRAMLDGKWSECRKGEVELQEEDEQCALEFNTFLKYLYTAKISLTLHNVRPVYILAHKYDVTCLEAATTSYILRNIATKECNQAPIWWQVAQLHDNINMAEKCEKFIIENFEAIALSTAWYEISMDNLIQLIDSSELVVSDELQVYKAAERWLMYHGYGAEDVNLVLSYVRLHLVRPHQLIHIEQESALYKAFPDLVRSYLAAAYRFQCVPKHVRSTDFLGAYKSSQLRLYTNSEYSYGFSVYENMATFTTTSSASSADKGNWKWQIISAPFIRDRETYNRNPNITAPSMFALTRHTANQSTLQSNSNDEVNLVLITSHQTTSMKYKRVWKITDSANWDKNVVRFRLPEPIVKKLQAKAAIPNSEVPVHSERSTCDNQNTENTSMEDVNSSDDDTIYPTTKNNILKLQKKCNFRIILLPKQA